jgi:hypothetical protein
MGRASNPELERAAAVGGAMARRGLVDALPSSGVARTSSIDLVLTVFNTLSEEEQEHAFARLSEQRLQRLAGQEGETARYIASLRRAAEYVGNVDLSVDEYRRAYKELSAAGDEVVMEVNRLIRYFGRWATAKEALRLSEETTPRKIEARFRARMVGKVGRYREQTLRETLLRCAEELGHPPLVIEFELWRQRELELAKARGEELWLPSDSPYRRRWGSWEAALEHFGFSPEEITSRLEAGREKANLNLSGYQFASPSGHGTDRW